MNNKIETIEQFNEFVDEILPQQLFHVLPTDRDENGIRCDEIILIDLLHLNPEVLKFKSLHWFVNCFIPNADKGK